MLKSISENLLADCVLSEKLLNEPVITHGPFVMNTSK